MMNYLDFLIMGEKGIEIEFCQTYVQVHVEHGDLVVLRPWVRLLPVEVECHLREIRDTLSVSRESDGVFLAILPECLSNKLVNELFKLALKFILQVNVWTNFFHFWHHAVLNFIHVRHIEDINFEFEWLWQLNPSIVLICSFHKLNVLRINYLSVEFIVFHACFSRL